MKKLNKKGFTLVELLAVIVILALLIVVVATTALPAMNNAKENAIVTYSKRVVDQVKGLYANAEIAPDSELGTLGCTKATSGLITCEYTDIKVIMGADVDTTYQIDPTAKLTISRASGKYNISGKITGAGFAVTIETNASTGAVTYTPSELS